MAMTMEQKIEATKDSVKKLEEFRATKALSIQNVPLNSFHDAHANLMSIENMVCGSSRIIYLNIVTNDT